MSGQEEKDENRREEPSGEETPLCTRCLTPVSPLQHYCHKCGKVVGQYTPYLPYEGIPFDVSIFGEMWKSLRKPKVSWLTKTLYLLFIAWNAPIMLIGLPFLLVRKLRKKSNRIRK